MTNLNEVFGRMNEQGTVDILYIETGEPVTTLNADAMTSNHNAAPSARHCTYEHAEGIELTVKTAKSLGIEIE